MCRFPADEFIEIRMFVNEEIKEIKDILDILLTQFWNQDWLRH